MSSLLVDLLFTCLLDPTIPDFIASDDYVDHHCGLVQYPGTAFLRRVDADLLVHRMIG